MLAKLLKNNINCENTVLLSGNFKAYEAKYKKKKLGRNFVKCFTKIAFWKFLIPHIFFLHGSCVHT